MGRLSTVTDWLGHTTTYGYGDAWTPDTPTTVTFPSAIGVTATYGYSNTGNVTSLAASSTVTSGPAISDSWGQNPDEQVNATTINSAAATSETYDGYGHVTHAANLYTSTSNDVFTVAANGEITTDAPPSGSSTSYAYNSGEELCSVNTSASASCTGTPTNGAVFSYTTNGQRASLTPYSSGTPGAVTDYAWNAFGELCNVATSATACGTTPTSGTSYSYNGNGVRMSAVTSSSTTDFTWDNVSAGGTPLDLNDATTTSSGTTNTSYLYGDLLFGGTAPVEQITTTTSGATVSYLVSNQTGVQGVYNGSGSSLGAVQEMAVYSVYGNQNFTSGTKVTPFAFQGSYADPTGLLYLINRYYDPTTDEFLSIDPDVADTDQPYVFTNDDPLNAEDPLGLSLLSALKSIGKVVVKIVTVASDLQSGDLAGAAKTLHKTLGVCVNGSAGFGIAGSGSACIGATGNGKVFTSLTGGGGGGSPNASAGIGFLISNAKTAQQLGRNFSYGSGSVGEGLSVGGEGAIGTSSNHKTIVVGTFSLNIGGPLPLQFQGGESWTIVKQW